jgi:hypothetical protein
MSTSGATGRADRNPVLIQGFRRRVSVGACVIAVVIAGIIGGCVPPRPTPSPEASPSAVALPSPAAPAGWTDHPIEAAGVSLALPDGWLALDEAALADPDERRRLEADFAGAEALFGRLDAQGRQARLVFLGVDARARGTGRFASTVTVVAVEPALPPLLLGIGADFTMNALERAFAIETDVTRTDVATPVGEGIRIAFAHRVVGAAGGPGVLAEHDGTLVTTGEASFLVSRNVDPETAPADSPTLDEFLATLRRLP